MNYTYLTNSKSTLENPLDCKIRPVNPERNQPWLFIEMIDAEAEAPILWPPDLKKWLIGRDRDTGEAWRQEERETTKDEMVGWHHWLNEHEFEETPGDGEGQGGLACCSPWGLRESDTIKWTAITSDIEHLFMCLLLLSLEDGSSVQFLSGLFVLMLLSIVSCL